MVDIRNILTNFYQAFKEGRAEDMVAYYTDKTIFSDPVFEKLEGERAKNMWRMLIEKGGKDLKINFEIIDSSSSEGTVKWTAEYLFGPGKKKVVNSITAQISVQDGKIIQHVDTFNFHNWSKQALGVTGSIFGKSKFLKKKVSEQAMKSLRRYEYRKRQRSQ